MMTNVRIDATRGEPALHSCMGLDHFPPVIAHFRLYVEEHFEGRGRIDGFYKLSASIIHLGRIADGINLISPDGIFIGSHCYASYAAACYALELWAVAYLTDALMSEGFGGQSEQANSSVLPGVQS